MGIHIHSRLVFKFRKDLVCPSFFPSSGSLRLGIHGILSVEITNHGLQIKKIPRHSRYRIHESRLDFFCIPESRAQFLPNPGSRRTPSRPCYYWANLRAVTWLFMRPCYNDVTGLSQAVCFVKGCSFTCWNLSCVFHTTTSSSNYTE